jgi:hypothetical protein
LSTLGLVLLAAVMIKITPESRFPGWWAFVVTAAMDMILSAGPQAWFNRFVLSSKPLVSSLPRAPRKRARTSDSVLGTCPGGMTEMSITAKVLQLGVPVVTALQLLRYIAVMLLTRRLWGWELRRLRRAGE